MKAALAACIGILVAPRAVWGQSTPPDAGTFLLAVAAGDDDENGTADGAQATPPPSSLVLLSDLPSAPIRLGWRSSDEQGRVRLFVESRAVALPAAVDRRGPIALQGLQAGSGVLTVETATAARELRVRIVDIALLEGDNRRRSSLTTALAVSRRVPNDAGLPRGNDWASGTDDPAALRVEVADAAAPLAPQAWLESVDPTTGAVRARLVLRLARPNPRLPLRSPWVRLVADAIDEQAPGVLGQLLRVALRDRIRVRYAPGSGTLGEASLSMRVGRPEGESGPDAVMKARLRIRILREWPGGPPVVGGNVAGAIALGREQVAIANEVWAQCAIGFGEPASADVAVIDPPGPTLVSVSDDDGWPAAGGTIRLRIGGRPIGPVVTRPGWTALQTAGHLAEAIQAAGFRARVTRNPRTEGGAAPSADVLVRTGARAEVAIAADGAAPLTTDVRQRVAIGRVDLGDGLATFDNRNASSGTIEERVLVKTFSDDDPSSIDVFVVNRFARGGRQGEAFILGDDGPILNAVILDRSGIRQQREAWTQSHEVGHVLLDQPYHPDNVGPDRPILLMDSDASLGTILGPKRLTAAECTRARATLAGFSVPPAPR